MEQVSILNKKQSSPHNDKAFAEQPSALRSKLGEENYNEILENWRALRDKIVAGLSTDAARRLSEMQPQEENRCYMLTEQPKDLKILGDHQIGENTHLKELNNIRTSLELIKIREKSEILNEGSDCSLLKNNSEINKRRILEYQKVCYITYSSIFLWYALKALNKNFLFSEESFQK